MVRTGVAPVPTEERRRGAVVGRRQHLALEHNHGQHLRLRTIEVEGVRIAVQQRGHVVHAVVRGRRILERGHPPSMLPAGVPAPVIIDDLDCPHLRIRRPRPVAFLVRVRGAEHPGKAPEPGALPGHRHDDHGRELSTAPPEEDHVCGFLAPVPGPIQPVHQPNPIEKEMLQLRHESSPPVQE